MTQKELAERAGLPAYALSRIEKGIRPPTAEQIRALERALGPIHGFVEPGGASKRLQSNARRCLSTSKLYESPRDRQSYVRFARALQKYPALVGQLRFRLSRRADFKDCLALCHRLAVDSADEALLILRLLVAGAVPCYAAPLWVGTVPHRIIDPVTEEEVAHRTMPCLAFQGEFYFFQLTLRSTGWQHRVDVLRCAEGRWSVIEVDGYGHDPQADAKREREIGLPTRRIGVAELVAPSFAIRSPREPLPKSA